MRPEKALEILFWACDSSALCFFGTALHEGAPVLDETQPKYLLRADVLYRRQRPRDAPPESADDRAAFVRPKPCHTHENPRPPSGGLGPA